MPHTLDVHLPVKTPKLKIIMEKPFHRFDDQAKAEFLRDLSSLSGCPEDEILDVEFQEGCIIFKGRIDPVALDRLMQMYQQLIAESGDSPELKYMKVFVEKFKISRITDDEIRVYLVPERKERKEEIVFVHGWSGDSSSFGSIPHEIGESFQCRPLIYDYPTSKFSHSPSFLTIARHFDNWIRNRSVVGRLGIIAHSYGGLVARRFLIMQRGLRQPLDENTKQVTFIASPHQGSALATIGKHIPGFASEQMAELSPDSPVLFELDAEWSHWVRRMVPRRCMVRSIYGTADKWVSATSAQGLDPNAVPILGADHVDIVRPDKPRSEIVLTLERFLREAGFGYPPMANVRARSTHRNRRSAKRASE